MIFDPNTLQPIYRFEDLPEKYGKKRVYYEGALFLLERLVLGKYYILRSKVDEGHQKVVVVCREYGDLWYEIFSEYLDGKYSMVRVISNAYEKILSHELNQTERSYVLVQSKFNEN